MGTAADASAPVRYETLRRLAVGGMGEIFLAREHGRLGFSRLVVIKRMLPELASKREFMTMFVDEARIVGHLNHPNICQILQLGEEDGVPFLALEYVRGESLAGIWDRAVTEDRPVPRAVTLRLLADTAWALQFAHEAVDTDGRALNIIHRDISPNNVMVSFQGDVKLMDFGIARADNRAHRTETGKVRGKIAYMSPEQLRGEVLDRRADVFAVGVMLWELTLNRRLFGGGGEVETLKKAIACEVPRPRSIDPSYPAALEDIVMAALAADRSRRTATAGELAQALQNLVTFEGGVERADVAAMMRDLFPDESAAPEDVAPTRQFGATPKKEDSAATARPTTPMRASDAPVRTASMYEADAPPPQSARVLKPEADLPRPTVALRAPAPTTVPITDRVARPAAPSRGVGKKLVVTVLALAVVGGGLWAGLTRPWEGRGSEPSTQAAVVAAQQPQPQPQPEPQRQPEPQPQLAPEPQPQPEPQPEPQPQPPPVKSGRPAPHGNKTHVSAASGSDAQPERPPVVEKAAPPPPPPLTTAAAPALGTLAVASAQTAVVSVDGVRRMSTPFQTQLAPGDHVVELELAEGGGTLRATAHVASGAKTKCRVDGGRLACAASGQ